MDSMVPGLRLFALLEALCALGRPGTLAELAQATGWPRPSVHRLLAQLEGAGWVAREPDGRRFAPAPRLQALAEAALGASAPQGVRRAVLRQLVADIGESCNLTALSGAEVIYLDREETAFPLRMELRPGTRVPLHCSASGKLFLAHLEAAERTALLASLPLVRYTAHTLTERAALDAELARVRRQGYALDAEEYVEGLVCAAVAVPLAGRRGVRCAVALQAPVARMSLQQAIAQVPRLQQGAAALARTWARSSATPAA